MIREELFITRSRVLHTVQLYLFRTHLLEDFPSPPPNVDNNDLLLDQNWFTQH